MRYLLLLIFFVSFFCECRRPVQDPESQKERNNQSAPESFVNINKYLVKRHQDMIESYVRRMGWEMTTTKTGLWYMVYEKGKGIPAEKNRIISLEYSISLLDGTLCDSSENNPPKSFRIGHGGVEAGLEEAVLYLRKGDKARIIMPPHLAHGNFGDREKIPPGAILLYDIEVINIR